MVMSNLIKGLHHVTALAGNSQKNLDFYSGFLGLRFVKKTINFDAPDVYHLYYGDEKGSPGTILTFFPIPGIPRGRKGKGQQTVTSFSIPENSLDYWIRRFEKYKIPFDKPQQRLEGEAYIYFEDHEGLGLELVAGNSDDRKGFTYGYIPLEHAIRGFYGITLTEEGYEKTAALFTEMDHNLVSEKGNRFRFSTSGKPGSFVDIVCIPDSMRGLSGSGTVHHVAFATPDNVTQLEARQKIISHGISVTPVIDRQYFHSIYFREPGGVLFEVATSDIGFELDEPADRLGENLKLPPWEEPGRPEIEKGLEPIQLNHEVYRD